MKVGLIAPPWLPVPPPQYGGTELVVDLLARGLRAAGHEVVLVTTGDSSCPVPRSWVLPHAETDAMGMIGPEMRHVLHAYAAVADCDVVHDHTRIGPLVAVAVDSPPVVTTNHGPFDDESRGLYRTVTPRVGVVAISHDQAADADGVPVAAVIHHGIDPEAYPVGSGDGDYFLFLGRMAPEKGVAEAAAIARKAGVRLLIAAKMREPLERQYFSDHVEPLLSDDVQYVGEVGAPRKYELLGAARALLNPIRWREPFGLVMLESLACGTPVLTYRAGAAPEIVEDEVTGLVCDDFDEMVEAIADVADLDRKLCRKAVTEYFSADRMVADHVRLYRQRR